MRNDRTIGVLCNFIGARVLKMPSTGVVKRIEATRRCPLSTINVGITLWLQPVLEMARVP